MSSPHVVPIHDFGEIDDQLYIDMRLINGADLDALLTSSGSLSPVRAVGIARQVAHALDSAHEQNLVHRDVKPSNVVLTSHRGDDFAYLVDFGIVRSLDASAAGGTALTETGLTVGSPAYMAPEVLLGDDYDERVDVYALGCLLFEAIAGRPPSPAKARD